MVYDFEHELGTKQYSFSDTIPVCIYQDLGGMELYVLGAGWQDCTCAGEEGRTT